MRKTSFVITGLLVSLVCAAPAISQTGVHKEPQQPAACPPDVKGQAPTVGGPPTDDLSDRLANSGGVICPPADHDPEIQVPPPGGGKLKTIPAPGTPGGNPNVQPK